MSPSCSYDPPSSPGPCEGRDGLGDVTNGEDVTQGGSLDFLLLLVLHSLTPGSHPAQGPADGELTMEEGEDRRGPNQG